MINKCHQRIIKENRLIYDLKGLPFNPNNIPLSEYVFEKCRVNPEISEFVKKYEWLGNIGTSPKWTFCFRVKGIIAGVTLINEPASYSKILGENTKAMECLIQRGCTVSWAHQHLGSKMLMLCVDWMVKNTDKRVFLGYSDVLAGEVGIIYQACNFEYLGNAWGTDFKLKHPDFKNGKEFSPQSLRRTSVLKKWCRDNNIKFDNSWLKENGFKDLSKLPNNIKQSWYDWGNKIISESERVKIPKKGKYILVKGKNRKEQKFLNSCKTYKPLPYPKRAEEVSR